MPSKWRQPYCSVRSPKPRISKPVVYEWGAVKWVANRDLDPGCEQSFGLVHILPGKVNPEHGHRSRAALGASRGAFKGSFELDARFARGSVAARDRAVA